MKRPKTGGAVAKPLKRCPFCGKNGATVNRYEALFADDADGGKYWVKCGCGVETALYVDAKGARRRWDTRIR